MNSDEHTQSITEAEYKDVMSVIRKCILRLTIRCEVAVRKESLTPLEAIHITRPASLRVMPRKRSVDVFLSASNSIWLRSRQSRPGSSLSGWSGRSQRMFFLLSGLASTAHWNSTLSSSSAVTFPDIDSILKRRRDDHRSHISQISLSKTPKEKEVQRLNVEHKF